MKRPGSPPSGSIKFFALVLISALLALAAYFLWDVSRQPLLIASFPTPPPPTPSSAPSSTPIPTQFSIASLPHDSPRVRERQKLIRLHEATLHDLEKQLGERTDTAGKKTLTEQIAEYRSRIAKIKAEIGE